MNANMVVKLIGAYWNGNKPIESLLERLGFSRQKKRSVVAKLSIGLLVVVLFLYFALLLGLNYYSYQTLGVLMGIPYLALFLGCALSCLAVLFFSLTSIQDFLYTGRDLMMLKTLGITTADLLVSRLGLLYISFAPLHWFVLFPAVVIGAFLEGVSVWYVIASLLLLAVGPLLPLSLSVFLTLLFVSLGKGRVSKALQQVGPMVMFVALIVGMSASFTRNLGGSSLLDFQYEAMLANLGPTLTLLTDKLGLFRIQAVSLFKVSSALISLFISLATVAVVTLVASATYEINFSKLLSMQGVRLQKRSSVTIVSGSPVKALMKRELVVLFSNSSFAFEAVGELLIPIILIIVYLVTGVLAEMEEALAMISGLPFFPQFVFLILLLMANLGMLSSTSVSRQGRMFVYDRLYPLPPATFVQAKLRLHLLLVGIPNVIYLTVSVMYFHLSMMHLLWMIPLSLSLIAVAALSHLALDYHQPKLDWTLAQQAMKSNVNGLIGLGFSFGLEVVAAVFLVVPLLLGYSFVPFAVLLLFACVFTLKPLYRLAANQASQALER